MKIAETLNNKKVLIWGYGREGRSTAAFIDTYCENTTYEIFEGSFEEIDPDRYDLIMKSPGIPYLEKNTRITSQTELFLKQFKDRTIAITGSKGKSTTSSLMYQVLLDSGHKAVLVGNIGYPCFDYYKDIDDDTWIVFEISAHQLNNIEVSPHIGAFLNLYEEHLDYYHTLENYYNAKANIGRFMNEDDYLLLGENVPLFSSKAHLTVMKNDRHFPLKLLGEHNQYNANFVYQIAHEILKIDEAAILETFGEFHNLSHRLDPLGTINGIDWYDDSISTIPQATINAIKAIPNIQTVLIGGMDRGIDYSVLIDFINSDRSLKYIFMYASGKRIYEALGSKDSCYLVSDLYEAAELAKQLTEPGKACVLSPAAASYDHFKNFEERGNIFKEYVKQTE